MRVVFDANVLVSALLSARGAPAQLIERWLAGELELIVCDALLGETERVLATPKIRRRIVARDAKEYVALLRDVAEQVSDPDDPPPILSKDPGDDYLLALAAREDVVLVSGDQHLLALRDRAPVLSPREFLDRLVEGR